MVGKMRCVGMMAEAGSSCQGSGTGCWADITGKPRPVRERTVWDSWLWEAAAVARIDLDKMAHLHHVFLHYLVKVSDCRIFECGWQQK